MKKLSPVMQALADDAPENWQATPPGYLVVLRVLQARRLVEIRPRGPQDTCGRPLGWEWRRYSAAARRKAS